LIVRSPIKVSGLLEIFIKQIKTITMKMSSILVAMSFLMNLYTPIGAQSNLALTASVSTSFVSGWESLDAVKDGATPLNSSDRTEGVYGNWSSPNIIQWVQYEWPMEYKLSSTEVYWFTDNGGILIPTVAYIEYWDGTSWINAGDIGVEKDEFNVLELPDIITNKVRISMSNPDQSTGIIEWRVLGGLNLPMTEWNGGPFTFDGISQYETIHTGILNSATDFSISTWVLINTLEEDSRIFDFGSSADKHIYLTGKGNKNNLQFVITNNGDIGEQYLDGPENEPLPIGSWHHVAIVKNSDTWILYLNGAEIGRNSGITLNLTDLGSLTSNFIGKSINNDLFLNGEVDEFNVFGSYVSETQIPNLINIEIPSNPLPANNWFIVSTSDSKKLEWETGNFFTASNVYIGNSYEEASNATIPAISELEQGINALDMPDTLTEGNIYYWRVDELNGNEVRKGNVWAFRYLGPKIKVVLLAGQSNMTGFTPLSDIPDELEHEYTDAIIWVDGQVPANMSRRWMNLQAGLGWNNSSSGPELSFGPQLANYLPGDNIAILKCSWGGTNLFAQWRPPSSGKTTGDLYNTFIESVHDGLAALPEEMEPEIIGMVWMQGEYDAIVSKAVGEEYESNLTNLIHDVRKEFQVPQMPFVIGQISEAPAWDKFGDLVRNAELKVSREVANTDMVITTDYGFVDGLHYDGKGVISLGKRFATSLHHIIASKGLRAEYYEPTDLVNPLVERTDTLIDFNWGSLSPDESINEDNFSAKWSGYLNPETTGVYSFYVTSGNGVRLWVDDVLLVENWSNNSHNVFTAEIPMKEGTYYPITIEFIKNSADATISLEWSFKGMNRSLVPGSAFYKNPLFALDKSEWEIKHVDSEINSSATGGATGVLDNRYKTYWKTAVEATFPLEIELDLKDTFNIAAVDYVPNQVDYTAGMALKYKILTSLDDTDWSTADSGVWNDDINKKIARFSNVKARYVKLQILTSSGTSVSASDLNVYGSISKTIHQPEPDFSSQKTMECNLAIVDFSDETYGVPAYWEWSFGDGTYSKEQNPQHIYTQEGEYTVKLIVFNTLGIDSISQTIEVIFNPDDCINSIKNEDTENQMLFYPNPVISGNMVKFEFIDTSNENNTLEIVNLQGQRVYNANIGANAEVDTRMLKGGIYFVTLQTSDYTQTKKLIVE
jgi:hypothetical protein